MFIRLKYCRFRPVNLVCFYGIVDAAFDLTVSHQRSTTILKPKEMHQGLDVLLCLGSELVEGILHQV